MKTATFFRRITSVFLCLLLLGSMACFAAAAEEPGDGAELEEDDGSIATVELDNAYMAFLYEPETDTILYQLEPDKHNAPASMTKVMTAVLVLEHVDDLNEIVTVPAEALSPEYCYWMDTDHLMEGEQHTVIDLLKYLLIPSGNESATTLAYYVTGGDIPAFIQMMNDKAAELGMTETHYEDPHGLSDDSYISARDMITLSLYAMKIPTFRNIVKMKGGTLPASGPRVTPMTYSTTNRVMNPGTTKAYKTDFASDVIGIKTGSTPAAGYNLSSCMKKDDLEFYSVVMRCSGTLDGINFIYGHYTETIKLLTFARQFSKKGYAAGETVTEISPFGKLGGTIAVTAQEDVYILERDEKELAPEIELTFTGTSIKAGDVIGKAILADEFGNVRETAIVAAADASRSLLLPILAVVVVLAVIVLVVILTKKKNARKANTQENAPSEQTEAKE